MLCKIRPIMEGISEKKKNTLLFAAQELQKYLCAVSDGDFSIIPTKNQNKDEEHAIYLGINLCDSLPDVENAEWDDAICINVNHYAGTITGTNSRAVLIAVYRFLKEIGFAFLHPGKSGERYPDTLPCKEVFVCEKPSYRHRCICSEGSMSQKCMTDTIDWIPKAAMNGYLTQFVVPRPFFNRWYNDHVYYPENTPGRREAKLSDEDLYAIVEWAEIEIEKRSLMYHKVGHGWTSRPLGIFSDGWGSTDEPDPKYQELIAEINGERKLWTGRPLNTNLCFSNPKARDGITDSILAYCKENPHVTHLHFWLSDGTNNHCECEKCRELRPSDWHVMMMNELDQKMTEAGIKTKVAFIVYVDTFWKPLKEKFENNDRFLLVFAPIFRSYTNSFDVNAKGKMIPFTLNKLEFPVDVADNVEYLRDWRKDFTCDGVDFDYHFMWDHYCDLPQYNHAKILSEDIKNLDGIGLNGLINCQIQRTFFPSSLSMNVMANTLWNKELEFDSLAEQILSIEFGDDYQIVKDALSDLSKYGCVEVFRNEGTFLDPHCRTDLEQAFAVLDCLDQAITVKKETENRKIASAWDKLEFFAKLYRMILNLAYQASKGEELGDISHVEQFVLENEMRFKEEFDAFYFLNVFKNPNRIMKALRNIQSNNEDRGGE